LILYTPKVAAKAAQTKLLMDFLAHRDPQLNPASLRQTVADLFCRVQQCWEARDYGPVSDRLRPGILAEHRELLRQMRKGGEINRIEGLRVKAVDFVRLYCPEDPDSWEVAALITFEATVYFVNDRDGAHTRGLRRPGTFQEFWVFRRQGERWLLDAIKQTRDSDLLQTANHVAGLSAEQLQNMQQTVAL
jgi:predicted lipid-binding transport protein (Tim44 family)